MRKKSNTVPFNNEVFGSQMPEIKIEAPKGVQQIRNHKLKESMYFRFPVVLAIKNHHLDEAVRALQDMSVDAAWWYSGRKRAHFAPLYCETTNVASFGDEDKKDFQYKLGMIAECLMARLRRVVAEDIEPVEVVPSVPSFYSERQTEHSMIRTIGLDTGHALNYRVLTLSHDGLGIKASFAWHNRRPGDKDKGEPMFIEKDQVNLFAIDLSDCKNDIDVAKTIVGNIFGNDATAFQEVMTSKVLSLVREISSTAINARRKAEDAARNRKQIRSIQNADLGW